MDVKAGIDAGSESPFVSTGRLPTHELVGALVEEAHERYRTNVDGILSQVYPPLALVPARVSCPSSGEELSVPRPRA